MMKRKIVKVTHKNGEVDFTIKKQIFPFIWITDSYDYWFGPGICQVMLRGMTLSAAERHIKNIYENERKAEGEKVIYKEDYKTYE